MLLEQPPEGLRAELSRHATLLTISLICDETLDDGIAGRSIHRHVDAGHRVGNNHANYCGCHGAADPQAEIVNFHEAVVGSNRDKSGDRGLADEHCDRTQTRVYRDPQRVLHRELECSYSALAVV
jgi:hypothetical protein